MGSRGCLDLPLKIDCAISSHDQAVEDSEARLISCTDINIAPPDIFNNVYFASVNMVNSA